MYTSVTTLLPLHEYARALGLRPLHFAGFECEGSQAPLACTSVWRQYDWQQPPLAGRDSIARAIREAEVSAASFLGCLTRPTWTTVQVTINRVPIAVLPWGRVRELDTFVWTSLGNVALVYDFDTSYAQATIPIPEAVERVDDVKVLYTQEVRPFGTEEYDLRFEVRAASWKVEGGVLIIRAPTWDLVDPMLCESQTDAFDCVATDIYVSEVNVWVGTKTGVGAWLGEIPLTARIADPRRGVVTLSGSCLYEGDVVTLSFLSGIALEPTIDRAIAVLATSRLDMPLCGCSNLVEFSRAWQLDTAEATRSRSFQRTLRQLASPLGTRAGELYAWRMLQPWAIGGVRTAVHY